MKKIRKNSGHQDPPMHQHPIKFRSRSWIRGIVYFFATVLIIIVGFFLYLQTNPAKNMIKKHIAHILSQNSQLQFNMGRIRGNMFSSFDIDDVEVLDPESKIRLISVERVHVSYSAPMALFKVLWIHKVEMHGMNLSLVQGTDGDWLAGPLITAGPADSRPLSEDFKIFIRKASAYDSVVSITRQTLAGEETNRFKGIECDASIDIGPVISVDVRHLAVESEKPNFAITELSGDVSFDTETSRLEVNNINMKSRESQLAFSGWIGFAGDSYEVDMNADIIELSLKEIGQVLSFNLPTEGKITGAVSATGNLDSLNHWLDLKWNDCEIKSRGLASINEKKLYELDFSGQIRQINPASFPVSGIENFSGSINADIDFKGRNFNMADRWCQSHIHVGKSDLAGYSIEEGNLTATITGSDLTLESLQLKTPYAGISGDASVQALLKDASDKQIHVNVDIEKLNPAGFFPDKGINGNINLSLESDMRVSPTFSWMGSSGSISGNMMDSTINGFAIGQGAMDATWKGGRFMVNRIQIQSGIGQADVSGILSAPERSCDFKLAVDLPDLKMVEKAFPKIIRDAALSGSIKAQGDISGSLDQPHAAVEVDGKDVASGDVLVESFNLKGVWDGNARNFSGTGECALNNLRFASLQIPAVDLKTQLSNDNARIMLNLQGGLNDRFRLSGDINGWLKPTKVISIDRIEFTSDDFPPLVNDGPVKMSVSKDGLVVDALRLDSVEASLELKRSLVLTSDQNVSAELALRDFDLRRVSDFWVQGEKIKGRLSSDILLAGTAANPIISITATLKDAAYDNFMFSEIRTSAQYRDSKAQAEVSGFQGDKKIALMEGTLMLDVSFYPFRLRPQSDGLDVRLAVEDISVSELPGSKNREYAVEGILNATAAFSGSLENPKMEGELKFSEGFLNLRRQKLTYENVTADIRFNHNQLEIVSFQMKGEKEGVLDVSGFISLDYFHPREFNLHVTGRNLFIPYQTAIAAKVIPDLKLTGTWDAPDITGSLTITQGNLNLDWFYSDAPVDIEIIEVSTPDNGTIDLPDKGTEPLPFFDPLFMDIRVNAPGNTWLKGTNENIEIKGSFSIKKNRWEMIKFYGPLKAVRGTYRFYGKVFNITEGELTFIGQEVEDSNPPWNAVGEIKISDVTIIIRLAGNFEKVNLTLDSDPVMDQVDIISYLVFGQPSDSLSQKESFTAGDAALSITGQMAVGEIRDILGEKFAIDYLDLNTVGGDIRQGSLALGKYVAPKVFVIYRHGFSQESPREVEVDYEINRNFTIQSQIDNEATSAVDLIWKYEF